MKVALSPTSFLHRDGFYFLASLNCTAWNEGERICPGFLLAVVEIEPQRGHRFLEPVVGAALRAEAHPPLLRVADGLGEVCSDWAGGECVAPRTLEDWLFPRHAPKPVLPRVPCMLCLLLGGPATSVGMRAAAILRHAPGYGL